MRLSGLSPSPYSLPTFRGNDQQRPINRSDLSRLENGTYHQKKRDSANPANNTTFSFVSQMLTNFSEYWSGGKKDTSKGLPMSTQDVAPPKKATPLPKEKKQDLSPEQMV